jgi:transposase InsO family protein
MHMRSGDNVEAKVALNICEHRDAVGQSEEWLIDSGASVHIVNDYTLLQNPTVYKEPRPLQLATEGVQSAITATGSVCIVNSEGKPLWLHNVQYVANANTNLISVSSGIRDGIKFIPREDTGAYCAMQGPADWECRLHEKHGLYFLRGVYPTRMAVVAQICTVPERTQQKSSEGKHSCRLRKIWHERLGHPGKTASERLSREDLCQGIPVSLIPCSLCETHCDPCVRGKQCRESFPPSNRKSPAVLHRLHADTVAVPTPGDDGERYFVTLLDEHSNFVCAIPLSSKTNVAAHMIEEIRRWERETGNKVHTIRTDRGTEFMNKTFHAFCTENGIHTEYSAAYTPEQNGRAERMNRTLIEKARTLLLGVEATEELWVDAVLTAAHLHYLMPVY